MEILNWLIEKRDNSLGDNCYHQAAMYQRFIDELDELRKRTTWRTDQPPKDRPIRICVDYPQGYLGESKAYGWIPLPEVE